MITCVSDDGSDHLLEAEAERPAPPLRIRLIGRAIGTVISRAPALWPLIRGSTAGYFDDLADGWDERNGASNASHLAALAVAVTKIDRRPHRALDLGTGTGVAALFLAREFPHCAVRGVDISPEMIKAARSKIGLDPDARVAFKVADAAELPYPDGHFDLITQLNMPPFFGEAARMLDHGGHVIVTASSGSRTPFFTPDRVLERGFGRHGFVRVSSGEISGGTWFVARKDR